MKLWKDNRNCTILHDIETDYKPDKLSNFYLAAKKQKNKLKSANIMQMGSLQCSSIAYVSFVHKFPNVKE